MNVNVFRCFVGCVVAGIGPKGQKDYSKWTFLVIPKYTIIKEGINKIVSKISCGNKPSLVSYYSLNVTGLVGTALYSFMLLAYRL